MMVAIAWGAKALRSRVTSVDDVEGSTGLVVIGAIPSKNLRRLSFFMDGQPLPPAADGLQPICRMLEHNGLGAEVKVVTIVPTSPRRLGSDFAAELARSLAHEGHGVIFVRANLRQASTKPNQGGFSNGLAELLQDDCSDDPVALLVSVDHHMLVLPAGRPQQDPAALLAGPRLREVIALLRRLGLVMIIEAPPASFPMDVLALTHEADVTLLIVQAGSRWKEVEEAAKTLRNGDTGDPAAVLVGMRRWGNLAVGIPPHLGINSGSAV
jgi:Mrp family chromosome partitioning ATPase